MDTKYTGKMIRVEALSDAHEKAFHRHPFEYEGGALSFDKFPTVGERFYFIRDGVGGATSHVKEAEVDGWEIIFRTSNSLYRLKVDTKGFP